MPRESTGKRKPPAGTEGRGETGQVKTQSNSAAEAPERTQTIADRIRSTWPRDLLKAKRWINWVPVPLANGKTTKIPKQVNGQNASTVNPDHWSDFDAAAAANPEFLGFVFTERDNLAGCDLDDVVLPNYSLEPWAEAIVTAAKIAGCIVELSPSGLGLHIIGTIEKSLGKGRKNNGAELYCRERFFTCTGNVLHQVPRKLGSLDPLVPMILEHIGPTNERDTKPLHYELLDAEATEKARCKAVENNATLRELLEGGSYGEQIMLRDYKGNRSSARMGVLDMLYKARLTPDEAASVLLASPFGQVDVARGKLPRLLKHELGKVWPAVKVQQDASDEFDFYDLDFTEEAPPPEFVIPHYLSEEGSVHLAGHGGAGKSYLLLFLALCIATGRPIFGQQAKRKRVTLLHCEDSRNVVVWRLKNYCRFLGIEQGEVQGWLRLVNGYGRSCILTAVDRGVLVPTERLDALAVEQRPDVFILDGVSDVFGGNENDRTHVKTFYNLMQRLAPLVVTNGHLNKVQAESGKENSQGYSGSTGWHNSVRSRWFMGNASGRTYVTVQKLNYGRAGAVTEFEWNDEQKLWLPGRSTLGLVKMEAYVLLILKALYHAEKLGRPLHVSTKAPETSAWKEVKDKLPLKIQAKQFTEFMEQLQSSGHIEVTMVKANRKESEAYRLTELGNAAVLGATTQEEESE